MPPFLALLGLMGCIFFGLLSVHYLLRGPRQEPNMAGLLWQVCAIFALACGCYAQSHWFDEVPSAPPVMQLQQR